MTKIPFSKLKIKKVDDSIKTIGFEEQSIEVKQYLPIQEKLGLIGRVIEYAHMQDENYSNPVKASVLMDLEIIYCYTNITFTDKQKEEPAKLYDTLYSSGLMAKVLAAVPTAEYEKIEAGVRDTIEAVYKYQNSLFGILDNLKENYSNLDLEAAGITEQLSNPETLGLVKDILTKLG